MPERILCFSGDQAALACYTNSMCAVRREVVSFMVAGPAGQVHRLSHKDLQNRRMV